MEPVCGWQNPARPDPKQVSQFPALLRLGAAGQTKFAAHSLQVLHCKIPSAHATPPLYRLPRIAIRMSARSSAAPATEPVAPVPRATVPHGHGLPVKITPATNPSMCSRPSANPVSAPASSRSEITLNAAGATMAAKYRMPPSQVPSEKTAETATVCSSNHTFTCCRHFGRTKPKL